MKQRPPLNLSLNTRLWLALGFCILPLFILTLYDYQKERQNALRDIELKGRLILNGALIAEEAAIQQMEMTLAVMARANDLKDLDPAECSGLARRMQASHTDLSNLGAATPDGQIFCSAIPLKQTVKVDDREWFIDAIKSTGVTRGQFLTGRISGKHVATFGYPLRSEEGNLRAVLFAASGTRWFDRFTHLPTLPEGWHSLLSTRNGLVVSHYPEAEANRGKFFSEESRSNLKAALSDNRQSLIMIGLDGVERLHVTTPLQITKGELIAMIAIPTNATLAVIEKQFQKRLLVLLILTAISLLLARRLLRELVDRSFSQTLDELKRLQEALDHVPAYVFLKDKEHRYVYANKKTLELFGLSREDLPGSTDDQFFPPATVEQLHTIEKQVFSGVITNEIIDVNTPPAPRRIYHEIKTAIHEGQDNALWGLCGISTDITPHFLAEETLRKLSRAIEQSPESIVFTNLKAEIEYVNDAFLQITGYNRDEVIGRNPRFLRSGKTPAKTFSNLWSTLSEGQVWRGEFNNLRKDGSELLESVTISPIRQPDGQITHYVAVKADITEQRRNETELSEYRTSLERLVRERTFELAVAKEAAEGANKAKSAFLANMSHEIRTPMNAIIGLNYLLLQGELKPEQADKVRKVSNAAEHLLQIINDILDLSKIEAGKLQLENTPFSPKDVIETVGGLIRERALAKGLTLNICTDGLPGRLNGDAMRLRQILLNFAGNAVKFTAHGSITLKAELLADDGDIMICRFSVQDTGIGIRADQIPRLFNAFEQLESSTTRRFGGTGLGLVIARHLTQLMGGEVGVDSTPDVGSTFWITARFTPAMTLDAAQEKSPFVVSKLHGRVLLAEDEPINQEIARDLLESVGLQVTAVNNGLAAEEAFGKASFDLILMDLQMPELDGFGATARIRALPGGSDIPIIALTANAFTEDRQRCMQAGMTDFLGKPVNPDLLYEMLSHYLRSEVSTPPSVLRLPVILEDNELLDGLRKLHDLLSNGNVEAGQVHETLRDTLQQRVPAEAAQLASKIATYNYQDAQPIVGHLLATLNKTVP